MRGSTQHPVDPRSAPGGAPAAPGKKDAATGRARAGPWAHAPVAPRGAERRVEEAWGASVRLSGQPPIICGAICPTEMTLPAGSRNHAMSGPPSKPREMPFSSVP